MHTQEPKGWAWDSQMAKTSYVHMSISKKRIYYSLIKELAYKTEEVQIKRTSLGFLGDLQRIRKYLNVAAQCSKISV